MIAIRRLDPTTDQALFTETFRWLEESPPWRRECEAVFGTLDRSEFLAHAHTPGRIDVGVFVDEVFIANVVLTMTARNTYEVHLDARRDAPLPAIVQAGISIRDLMFDRHGAKLVYAYTPRWNRPVLAVIKALGFSPSGLIMLRGTCQGRLIEWVHCAVRKN